MTRPTALLCSLLLFAILIRIIVMLYSFQFRENTDVIRYKDWGRISYLHGIDDSYKPDHLSFGTLPNNQPPISTYSISAMYYLHIQAAKIYLLFNENTPEANAFIIGPLLNTFLRLPQIIADLLIGIVTYCIVRKHTSVQKTNVTMKQLNNANKQISRKQLNQEYRNRHALLATSLFLFNPVVIYNSAFWGQMDSLNNVFFLFAIFFLLKKRPFLSLSCLCISLLTKFSLIFMIPLYTLLMLRSIGRDIKKILLAIITAFATIFVSILPLSPNPFPWLYNHFLQNSLGEMQHITNFAFNIWWVIFRSHIHILGNTDLFQFSEVRLENAPLDSTMFFGISLQWVAFLLFFIFVCPFLWTIAKNKKQLHPMHVFQILSFTALLAFLLLPRMHERYMYPVFPLLATYIGLSNKQLWVYLVLSICNLINLYIVWHPMRLSFFPYEILNNQNLQWIISIVVVITTLVWYIRTIQQTVAHEKDLH